MSTMVTDVSIGNKGNPDGQPFIRGLYMINDLLECFLASLYPLVHRSCAVEDQTKVQFLCTFPHNGVHFSRDCFVSNCGFCHFLRDGFLGDRSFLILGSRGCTSASGNCSSCRLSNSFWHLFLSFVSWFVFD